MNSPLKSILSEDDDYSLLSDDYITVTGSSGSYLTGSGGSYSWSPLSTTLNTSSINTGTITATASPYTVATGAWNTGVNITTDTSGKSLHVNGGAVFEGDITVQGVKLGERLAAIEERLGILRPNNDLENKWEKLKALGEEYRKLEQEILEGEKIWDTLKK